MCVRRLNKTNMQHQLGHIPGFDVTGDLSLVLLSLNYGLCECWSVEKSPSFLEQLQQPSLGIPRVRKFVHVYLCQHSRHLNIDHHIFPSLLAKLLQVLARKIVQGASAS